MDQAIANIVLIVMFHSQIAEKEKWQRYCWELEGRLHEATNTSHIKERDLWRTKDAKKEESRKNMLLYIEAHKGKRHFSCGAEPTSNTNLESKPVNSLANPEKVATDLELRSLGNNDNESPNKHNTN
ncbi:hypothetical protein V7S43_003371 [Phytophthora oleae]|uniref:Uncharacterized protein n=1 Tax=Phytophthora oleae TaxID=2107226 RepID=A0ABD3G2M7_9STRA